MHRRTSTFIFAALLATLAAHADTITVGSGSGAQNVFPFGSGQYSGEYQQAYSASSFSGSVTITALSFLPSLGSIPATSSSAYRRLPSLSAG